MASERLRVVAPADGDIVFSLLVKFFISNWPATPQPQMNAAAALVASLTEPSLAGGRRRCCKHTTRVYMAHTRLVIMLPRAPSKGTKLLAEQTSGHRAPAAIPPHARG